MVRKVVLILFIVLLCGAGVLASLFFKTPSIIQEKKRLEALIAASFELRNIWEEGDVEKKWKSGKYKCELGKMDRVGDDYFRCNPDFLDCYFSNEKIKVEVRGKDYLIGAKSYGKKFHQIVARSKDEGIAIPIYATLVELVIAGNKGKSLKVLLEDTCSETYLPQRIYGYGPYQKEDDWRWDNFGQHILIDKFQVSGADYSKFQKSQGHFALPQTNLTLKQMEQFCAYRGKELVPAHIFDAAAFHPGDIANSRPRINQRGPYPWSTRKKQSFLYRAIYNGDFFFESRYCKKVFTKECLRYFRLKGYDIGSVSWAGIYQVLGGVMEVHRNVIEQKRNLMPSSYLFDVRSYWHGLGRRAFWDGTGYFSANFDWFNHEPEEVGPLVGFRCMRYVSESY